MRSSNKRWLTLTLLWQLLTSPQQLAGTQDSPSLPKTPPNATVNTTQYILEREFALSFFTFTHFLIHKRTKTLMFTSPSKYTFLRHFKISSFTVTHEHCSLSNACIPYPFKVYKLALHEIQVTHTGTLSLLLWTFFIWGKNQQDLEQSASLWQRKACAQCAAGRSEARLGGFERRASSKQTLNLQPDLRSPSDVTELFMGIPPHPNPEASFTPFPSF